MKPKRSKSTAKINNKFIAAAMSKALEVPHAKCLEILDTILKYIIKRIKEDHRVVIKRFGRFKVSKWKLSAANLDGKRHKYRIIKFTPAHELKRYLGYTEARLISYPTRACNKIRRLRSRGKLGDLKEADRVEKMIRKYLQDKPKTTAWLKSKGYFPP